MKVNLKEKKTQTDLQKQKYNNIANLVKSPNKVHLIKSKCIWRVQL